MKLLKNFKKDYKSYFNSIKPDPALLERKKEKPKTIWYFKATLATGLLLVVLLVGINQTWFLKFIDKSGQVALPGEIPEAQSSDSEGVTEQHPFKVGKGSFKQLILATNHEINSNLLESNRYPDLNYYHGLTLVGLDETYKILVYPKHLLVDEKPDFEMVENNQAIKVISSETEVWVLIGPEATMDVVERILSKYQQQPNLILDQSNLVARLDKAIKTSKEYRNYSLEIEDFVLIFSSKDQYIFRIPATMTLNLNFPFSHAGLVYDYSEFGHERFIVIGTAEAITQLKQWLKEQF